MKEVDIDKCRYRLRKQQNHLASKLSSISYIQKTFEINL